MLFLLRMILLHYMILLFESFIISIEIAALIKSYYYILNQLLQNQLDRYILLYSAQ